MARRSIVHIDEEKCIGCGKCVPNCGHGVLKVVDGKARIVNDEYCDGLGACLGSCPRGAITIVEREAGDADGPASALDRERRRAAVSHEPAACPGVAALSFAAGAEAETDGGGAAPASAASALTQWPVQLALAPVKASFFDGAHLLLAADCVPFALADFHGRLLKGRKLVVGCPKLDDAAAHEEKLAAILRENDILSLTVAHMEVPCCYGLEALAGRAVARSGKQLGVEEIVIGVHGNVKAGAESVRR